MHFSPERLCDLCAAAYPRMISVGVPALYHSHEAGTLVMLHTHQTKGCELHSTIHVPTLRRTFSIFPNCECGVANPWSVRTTLISGSICTTAKGDQAWASLELDFQGSPHLNSGPWKSFGQPESSCHYPLNSRTTRPRKLGRCTSQYTTASICAACSYPPVTKPQEPGPRATVHDISTT